MAFLSIHMYRYSTCTCLYCIAFPVEEKERKERKKDAQCDGAEHLGSKVGGVEHPFVSGILPVLLAYVYHTTQSPADSFLSPHAFDSV